MPTKFCKRYNKSWENYLKYLIALKFTPRNKSCFEQALLKGGRDGFQISTRPYKIAKSPHALQNSQISMGEPNIQKTSDHLFHIVWPCYPFQTWEWANKSDWRSCLTIPTWWGHLSKSLLLLFEISRLQRTDLKPNQTNTKWKQQFKQNQ